MFRLILSVVLISAGLTMIYGAAAIARNHSCLGMFQITPYCQIMNPQP